MNMDQHALDIALRRLFPASIRHWKALIVAGRGEEAQMDMEATIRTDLGLLMAVYYDILSIRDAARASG